MFGDISYDIDFLGGELTTYPSLNGLWKLSTKGKSFHGAKSDKQLKSWMQWSSGLVKKGRAAEICGLEKM